ncbi:hypothetical protein [Mycobacteroides abscessus]|uniref:hypothetical protein n=1 Tax=Mycobacteroides abscessus TaxID=36809 RepID=UPI00148F849E|nr:hypothetical protein [Mycobacteroides abscessus]
MIENWPPTDEERARHAAAHAAEIDRQNSPEHQAWVTEHRAEIDAAKARIRVEDL